MVEFSYDNMTSLFSTYKIPKKCIKYMDPKNSLVNLFKGIFACYDNKKSKFLPHKTIVVNEKHTEVMGVLIKDLEGNYKITNFNN